ncbi:spore coat protein [Virgibacillus soli]|uniref:Spore coat protein n=1 Tax=Paracerasibacillus soli TaxID=480284 RepID=A0ABU5CMZ1_9BACI|nr:spore coat protein [Virgibacillus soli]MDY0407736.1 spore coat protein [Virgibacillus soli]
MESTERQRPNHLAWHETLELHEIVAMQSTALMKMKLFMGEIKDRAVRNLYREGINNTEKELRELLKFYSLAPREEELLDEDFQEDDFRQIDAGFYAAVLLSHSKTAVKTYAAAITETATPRLRKTFTTQLQRCIQFHEKVFNYMFEQGLYPAYDLKRLLEGDVQRANKALNMRVKEQRDTTDQTD